MMKTLVWTALFIHVFSFYSLARYSQLEELETKIRIQYAQTAIDSKDREIGIKRYSDPSVFPMIGWRGMIIETDDRDSTYYIEISNYEEDMSSIKNTMESGSKSLCRGAK
jgi:hypothetical protein